MKYISRLDTIKQMLDNYDNGRIVNYTKRVITIEDDKGCLTVNADIHPSEIKNFEHVIKTLWQLIGGGETKFTYVTFDRIDLFKQMFKIYEKIRETDYSESILTADDTDGSLFINADAVYFNTYSEREDFQESAKKIWDLFEQKEALFSYVT